MTIEQRQRYKISRRRSPKNTNLDNYLKTRMNDSMQRAKRKKIEFNLTFEFLLNVWNKQNGLCAISGIPMSHITFSGRIFTNASVDRINSELGYTKDNIQLVCSGINMMKGELTMPELYFYCKTILANNNIL